MAGSIDPTDPNLTSPDFPDQTMTLVEDLPDGLYTVVVQNSPNADPYATDLCSSVALEFEIANEIDMDYTPVVEVQRHRIWCYDEFIQGLGLARVTNDDFGEFSIEWNRVNDMGVIDNGGDPKFPQIGFFADSLLEGRYRVTMTNLITGCDYSDDFFIEDRSEENTPDTPEVTLLADEH